MEVEATHACARVSMAEPQVIVYACTSGSFFEGRAWNENIATQLSAIAGVPTVTTAGAMAASLLAANARKVAVVTPYVELTNNRLIAFLLEYGIDVGALGTFDMLDMFDHAKIQPADVYAQVRATLTGNEDAVFIACTQVRALEVVDMLERDLGIPVYSAVQATLWMTYKTLGIDPELDHLGSLLRAMPDVPSMTTPGVLQSA